MKNLKTVLLLTLFTTLALISCKKPEVPDNTPRCIIKKINKEKDNDCLKTVYACDYNNKTVYFFMYPCPEGCYALVDKDCNTLKDTNGNSICSCHFGGAFCSDDFSKNKTNERLIWQAE